MAPPIPPAPSVAFLLASEHYELIFGEEHGQVIRTRAKPLFEGPIDLASLSTWPKNLEDAEVIFTGWGSPCFDETLLNRLPRLRAVFHSAGSFRPYMSEAFWRRGILVTTAATAMSVPVADYTLATILLSLKRAWALDRLVRRERTFPQVKPPIPGARGSTVGLISLGRIGELVQERLRNYDMRVIGYDPHLPPARFQELGIESVTLPELMARSDVVSLHAPLINETKGFITGDLLRLLKSGATFINTARGALVREADLIAVWRERPDLQAILDVTFPEPPLTDSPLYDLPNIFITPHISGPIGLERRELGRTVVEEFLRYLRGEPLRYTLSREQADRET